MIINAFYNNDVVYAVGMTIIHSVWQIILISLLLVIILKVLKNSPASTRYLFLISSMILTLVICTITFIYHFNHSPSLIQTSTGELTRFDQRIIYIPENFTGFSKLPLNERIYENLNPYFPVISLVYFLVALILAVKLTFGIIYINKFRRYNISVIPEPINEKFLFWLEKMQISPGAKLVESALVNVPMVIGYFRPVIIFPLSAFSQIPYDQLEVIILHELAHIKRKDYLLNIIQAVIEIVFFYHPLIYWMAARVSEERENCCDDIALKYCKDTFQYARALASVGEARVHQLFPSSSLAFVKKKKNLLERIKRILNPNNMKTKISDRILAGIIIVTGTLIFLLTGSATLNDLNFERSFDNYKKTEFKVNLNPVIKERDTIINISKGTIITTQKDKNGITKEVKMKMDKGELKELYINGEKIHEKEFHKEKDLVESTLKEIEKAKQVMAKKDLEEVKVEIEKAMDHIDAIDKEEIARQVEKIKIEIEKTHQNHGKNNEKEIQMIIKKAHPGSDSLKKEEISRHMKIIKKEMDSIDFDEITAEVHKHLKDIDHEKIQLEINQAMRKIQDEDINKALEKVKKELDEINADSLRTIIKLSVKKFDEEELNEELNKVMEKTRKKLESVNIDSIVREVEKSLDHIQIKIIEMIDTIPEIESYIPGKEFPKDPELLSLQPIKHLHKDIRFSNDPQMIQSLLHTESRVSENLIHFGNQH